MPQKCPLCSGSGKVISTRYRNGAKLKICTSCYGTGEQQLPKEKPNHIEWEYNHVEIIEEGDEFVQTLNTMGYGGWEYIGKHPTENNYYLFKRIKHNN